MNNNIKDLEKALLNFVIEHELYMNQDIDGESFEIKIDRHQTELKVILSFQEYNKPEELLKGK